MAQEQRFSIRGVVKDGQSVPLPFATVALHDPQNEAIVRKALFTDENGHFDFPDTDSGGYVLKNQHLGLRNAEHIWVKGKKLVQIRLLDIVIVKVMAGYMDFMMPESRVTVHITMTKLEEFLPVSIFLRVNRSTIARQRAIRPIEDLQIETILPEQR